MEEDEDIRREGGSLPPRDALMEKPVVQLELPDMFMLWRVYHPVERWSDVPWLRRSTQAAKHQEHVTKSNKTPQIQHPICLFSLGAGGDEECEDDVKDKGRDLQVKWDPWKRGYSRGRDLMDEEGFDEAASFPTFKPDRDLFGPLRRYRKQRGWHHVKRWSPAMHSIVYPPPQEEYATGADIPPELFNDIVECFLKDHWGRRRGLGALRLVCRHWERLCMGIPFSKQTLRSYADVMDRLAGLQNRRGWGWQAYPISDLHLHLGVAQNSRGWIDIVQTKLVSTLDAPPRFVKLEITGPLPAKRILTSVYLSSPCRSPWRPLRIQDLTLEDLHFRKLDDLIRVLRELPFLKKLRGSGITWDSALDVYPRATTFIPGEGSSYATHYGFEDSPHLAGMLACALSPSGTPPIAQPDAYLLCALVSTFAISPRSVSQRNDDTIAMYVEFADVGLAPTQSRSQPRTVQVIVLDDIVTHSETANIAIPWQTVDDCVERLVSRPNLFLLFPSLHSASAFREDVATPNMPRLVSQGRLKYVVKKLGTLERVWDEEKTWSLVEHDGNGWRVLVTEPYIPMQNRNPRVYRVRELAARLPDH